MNNNYLNPLELPGPHKGLDLLDWFSTLGLPLTEKKLNLGDFEYFHFSTLFNLWNGGTGTAHGRSQNRKLAAIKCVGEYVERITMLKYFQNMQNIEDTTPARHGLSKISDHPTKHLPSCLNTSNGWAVHETQTLAIERARLEALERHLLLKSFLKFGWSGFCLVDTLATDDLTLYLMISLVSSQEKVSGIVGTKSKLYPGVSFGYCVGDLANIGGLDFWEPAIFESVDKILTLGGRPIDLSWDQGSWIAREVKDFLENPFDFGLFSLAEGVEPIPESQDHEGLVDCFDLGALNGFNFPLHACYVSGGEYIPLFNKSSLDTIGIDYLSKLLSQHDLPSEIPERHPIL